jgi:hypothetical protein
LSILNAFNRKKKIKRIIVLFTKKKKKKKKKRTGQDRQCKMKKEWGLSDSFYTFILLSKVGSRIDFDYIKGTFSGFFFL